MDEKIIGRHSKLGMFSVQILVVLAVCQVLFQCWAYGSEPNILSWNLLSSLLRLTVKNKLTWIVRLLFSEAVVQKGKRRMAQECNFR